MSGRVQWLECPECGDELFEADEDGLFYEDEEERCKCGALCAIRVEEDDNADPSIDEPPGQAWITVREHAPPTGGGTTRKDGRDDEE
ncbi:MAG TPA: hypothetical protein VM686_10260 [Polyangiaceae bacterium]|jgi:hypothetical protein|nr:hypothetical protein [Polyangiaceae bacterium]